MNRELGVLMELGNDDGENGGDWASHKNQFSFGDICADCCTFSTKANPEDHIDLDVSLTFSRNADNHYFFAKVTQYSTVNRTIDHCYVV